MAADQMSLQPQRAGVLKPKVLIVDDDRDLLFLLKRTLTERGYHVDTAADGNAGWNAFTARRYDLLITDHNMPGLTGLSLIRKVRDDRPQLPCVLYSSQLPRDETDFAALVSPGAALTKDYPFTELLAEIVTLLPPGRRPNSVTTDTPVSEEIPSLTSTAA